MSTLRSVPSEPLDNDIYELPPEELRKVPTVASHRSEAPECLKKDYSLVLRSEVFTSDFLNPGITTKRKAHDVIRLRRHSHEFFPTTIHKKNPCEKAPHLSGAFFAEKFGKRPILLAETRCE